MGNQLPSHPLPPQTCLACRQSLVTSLLPHQLLLQQQPTTQAAVVTCSEQCHSQLALPARIQGRCQQTRSWPCLDRHLTPHAFHSRPLKTPTRPLLSQLLAGSVKPPSQELLISIYPTCKALVLQLLNKSLRPTILS